MRTGFIECALVAAFFLFVSLPLFAATTGEDANFAMQLIQEIDSSKLNEADQSKLNLVYQKIQIIKQRENAAVQNCKIAAINNSYDFEHVAKMCSFVQSYNESCFISAINQGYDFEHVPKMCK